MVRAPSPARLSMLRRFAADRAGNPSIELAFLAPILIVLLLSVANAGMVIVEKARLQRAATVAVQWGSQSEFTAEADMVRIVDYAGRSYGGDINDLSITAQTVTLCSDGGDLGDLDRGDCDTSNYLQVLVSRDYPILFDIGLFPDPIRLSERAVRRHMY